jgi:quercetin dioxygenase-like cupin family protein
MLVQAARESGSPHFIFVSIVGVDRSPAPYYRAKREAERLIAKSGLPWSVVRATQFHSFGLRLIQSLGTDTLNIIPVPPHTRLQTIATEDVAERLVALVECGATHQIKEMGGPQALTLEEMVQSYLRERGREASLRSVELSNSLFAAFRSAEPPHPVPAKGRQTWDEFVRSWYRERDNHPAPKAQVPILMEETVQVHDPVQVSVLTVTLDPGAQGSPPHRHPGPVFGYVVEGEILFEMRGHHPRIYKQGEAFYEPYGCLHLLANNPSPFRRAVFVAVLLGEPGQPILTPVQLQAGTNDPVAGCQSTCS